MKWTKMMIQTLREDPGDAEIDSHKLLVRAALVPLHMPQFGPSHNS